MSIRKAEIAPYALSFVLEGRALRLEEVYEKGGVV
jgi:hypothetical protein